MEISMKNGKRVFALLLALLLLTGCGGKGGRSAGPVPLTEEEIALVNEALASVQFAESKGSSAATERALNSLPTHYYSRLCAR